MITRLYILKKCIA
ncbi:hypothetical protein GWQ29_06725 [Aeromonas sp. 2HA2]|nr:hypothetical protein [Aeromonas sp. 2HA2]